MSFTTTSNLQAMFAARHDTAQAQIRMYDLGLVMVALALVALGIIMVASASMPEGIAKYNNQYFFIIRHAIFSCMALITALFVLMIPISWWQRFNPYLLLLAFGLLVAVLLVGRSVNGAQRWLTIGPINIQAAEPTKLFFFCFLAGYLERRYAEVTENIKGFIKPLIVFFVLGLCLWSQPDLGTTIVMFITTLGLLFLAGAKLWQFIALVFTGIVLFVTMIILEEYRMRRITAFLDPWADPFGTGYQLTQSLMAYGRGDWFGQGLGNSIQKLQFLPEAHTDFIVAIIAEELGYIGIVILLGLILTMVIKALFLGNRALKVQMPFAAYLAYGIGIWFSFQTFVNIGGSAGLLPTKGLTLPLVSYGGSSMIIMAIAVALLIRIDFEVRCAHLEAANKPKRKTAQTIKKKASAQKSMASQDPASIDSLDEVNEIDEFDDFVNEDPASA